MRRRAAAICGRPGAAIASLLLLGAACTGESPRPASPPDPSSARAVEKISTSFPQDLEIAFGSVWTTNEFQGTVTRIDPSTNKITETIRVGFGLQSVEATSDAIWTNGGGGMARIDPRTNQVVSRVPGTYGDLAFGFGSIWAAEGKNVLRRIDPTTGRTVSAMQVGRPIGRVRDMIAIGEGTVWFANGASVYEIDPEAEAIVGRVQSVGFPSGVIVADDAVWVTGGDGTARRLDLSTNRSVPGSAIRVEGLCTSLVDRGSIWAGCEDGTLHRFDPTSGEPTGRWDLSEGKGYGLAGGIAFGYGALWIATGQFDVVRRWPLPLTDTFT